MQVTVQKPRLKLVKDSELEQESGSVTISLIIFIILAYIRNLLAKLRAKQRGMNTQKTAIKRGQHTPKGRSNKH